MNIARMVAATKNWITALFLPRNGRPGASAWESLLSVIVSNLFFTSLADLAHKRQLT
jgi:hypothetical protein